ncbi:hypothetical protein ACT4UL_24910, partial [Bacillus sp. HC-TM]
MRYIFHSSCCSWYRSAKSSISEDLVIIKQTFEQ